MFFVADIGGTNLRTAIVDANGTIFCKSKQITPKDYKQLLQILTTEFYKSVQEFRVSEYCISVAGAVFSDGNVWLPNVFGSNRFDILHDLKHLLDNYKGYAIDDRVAGLMGELWKGCAVGKKDVLYLVVGTGVGLGIFANGTLITGNQNLSGSVGWIRTFDPLTGKFENMEDLISGPAIVKKYKEISGIQVDSAQDVFNFYFKKDKDAEKVVVNTSWSIGYLLSILTNTFNPDLIVLAGSLALQWNILQEHVLQALQTHTSPFIQKPQVRTSFLGEDAQLIGCARYTLMMQERSD